MPEAEWVNGKAVGMKKEPIRRIANDSNTRAKIQTTKIAQRLMKHILGDIEMTATQVSAALGLLKKTLPDLQSQEIKADINTVQRVISAQPVTDDEFKTKYSVESASGSAELLN